MHQHATEPEHFITGENQTLNVLADIARPIRLRLMFRANVGTFAALNEAFKSLCEHYAALLMSDLLHREPAVAPGLDSLLTAVHGQLANRLDLLGGI
jgi:hypothetical protein